MKKKNLLEYYEGDPDSVYDTEKYITWHWSDKETTCFGYFPTSLDNDYELLSGHLMHSQLAKQAAEKLIGKAMGKLTKMYEPYVKWIENQCYDKAYCLGRYWEFNNPKYPNIMSFWDIPSSKMVKEIVNKLGIDPSKFVLVTETYQKDYEKNITVLEYIESNSNGEGDGEKEIQRPFKIDPQVDKIIRSYNKPNETWQSMKEKEGWKSLAQRNATIYQEEKKPKNTIKEENMNKDKYQKEFSNYISIMNEALKKNDFAAYNAAKEMLEETIEDSKQEKALLKEMETNNFGILNHIFENELPTLFKNNKKAVREVIKTIKEDKNLLGQFNFYHIIKEQYKGETATKCKANELLEKLVKIVAEDVDASTVKASNKKLRKVMVENGIVPTNFVDNDSKALYESGNIILTKKKTTANMMPLVESYDAVCKYMENHKNDKVNKAKDIDTIIEEFENKLKDTLTESEISFVQQITDFRSPIAEQRKEKLFNKFKNECIEKISQMLKEDANNFELKSLNEQIKEMKYNKESIVKDIAKLLEIRDILMDD